MVKKTKEFIYIKGARENNLKNITVNIPKNSLISFTGVSGSGKSSLAFGTIYAEGQRRYLDSLSAYVRQFMSNINKPDVDSIEGLSPAISIDQKTTSKNPRSTVATMTEIADYFRLLFSRIGVPYCPKHNVTILSQDLQQIVNRVKKKYMNRKIYILSPIVMGEKGRHDKVFEKIKKEGFIRVRINKEEYFLEDIPILDKNKKNNIDIIIDRIILKDDNISRLSEAIENSLKYSNNKVIFNIDDSEEVFMSADFSCPYCNFTIPSLEPRFFSFNSPYGGACEVCSGIGIRAVVDVDKFLSNKNINFTDLMKKFSWNITKNSFFLKIKNEFSKRYPNRLNLKIKDLNNEEINFFLYGENNKNNEILGILPYLERVYQNTSNEFTRYFIGKIIKEKKCDICNGKRYSKEALSVRINNKNIGDYNDFTIDEALKYFKEIKLNISEKKISKLILKEITDRLIFLHDVGLGYLTLNRRANTLSGGESQRIRLATQIGAKLTGVIYVLDEPSIGLHQKDNNKLIKTLKNIRDLGNTVIVVEHDEDTIKSSDYIIDIGPKAGINGGQVIATGTVYDIKNSKRSLTGDYLSGRKKINLPSNRRKGNGNYIKIIGAKENNLKNINVSIPLETFTCITGVSGSGKSTLINSILLKSLKRTLNHSNEVPGKHENIEGLENINRVINVDQSPIGKTPRSNPATYTGVFDDIRDLFSKTSIAKEKGYTKGRFSFNVKGGRCESCKGEGFKKIEMHFLPDVYVKCDVCDGKRYNNETLKVKYKNYNIFDILNSTVEKSLKIFENLPSIEQKLKSIYDVGLGYIKLGQFATTLSGGEAQRVKLSSELYKKSTKKTLYILDEPSTGLHVDDVNKLLEVLQKLVDYGNTVLIIEHNLDIIKVSDYIIDLGPDGGDNGGNIVFQGTPEEIIKNNNSYTGCFLKEYLN